MPENTEVQAALVLDFGDGATETFKAHRYANQFLLVKHVDDLFGDGYEALRAASILVMDQVEEERWVREAEVVADFLARHEPPPRRRVIFGGGVIAVVQLGRRLRDLLG